MSESDSNDSDNGIRYKTESVRNKLEPITSLKKSSQDNSSRDPTKSQRKRKYSRSPSPKSNRSYMSSSSKNKGKDNYRENKKRLSDKNTEEIKSPVHEVNKNNLSSKPLQKHISQNDVFGPPLPPHLLSKQNPESDTNKYKIAQPQLPSVSIGPQLPTTLKTDLVIGPILPSHLEENDNHEAKEQTPKTQPETLYIGPQLPPHLLNKQSETSKIETSSDCSQDNDEVKNIGPSLPPHLRKKFQEEITEPGAADNLPSDEDVYGPLPAGMSINSESHRALEERAFELKINQLEPKTDKEPERESWMIELPQAKAANLGLGSRQFRNRPAPDMSDRSSWTDLPNDKKKKKEVPVNLKEEAEARELRRRDEEQEKMSKKHKGDKTSLLKKHQEKLKKLKKDEEPSERRPFSRELDLQVNRFDDAQKKAILKKAELLDDRFSSGKSKFL